MNENTNNLQVEIHIPEIILSENESLNSHYKKDKSLLVYEMNELVPSTVTKELKEFLESELIGGRQIAVLNPLINAINELQEYKTVKYNDKLTTTALKTLNDNPYGAVIEYDEDIDGYFWDFVNADLKGEPENEVMEKLSKELEKALKKQHDFSYQIFKDAKKYIGGFNSALKEAKKTLKDPYLSAAKQIEEINKLLSGESDDTKSILESNFKKALDKEEEKKRLAEEKKKTEELALIKNLSEENKERGEKLEEQNKLTKRLGIINKFQNETLAAVETKVFDIEKLSDTGLQEIEVYVKSGMQFPNLITSEELNELEEGEMLQLQTYFTSKRNQWISFIEKEKIVREAKKKAETEAIANQVRNEQVSHPLSETKEVADPDLPFFENPGLTTDLVTEFPNEHEKFAHIINQFSRVQEDLAFMIDNKPEFQDEFYQKWSEIIFRQLHPKITDMVKQTREYAYKKQSEYRHYINRNIN